VSSASDSSYYLPLHLGFNDKRATATSNYSAVVSSDFTYCETPFWGTFRFPLNSNSKVVLRPNLVSQVSNWENFEVENESETDVTVAGVFNAYSRSVNFKKVKISNISWFNLFQCDFFKSYCSEILSDSTCTINSTLAQLLFGNSSYTSVYINVSESGFGEVTYEFENLISYYITIIPVEFLETV
jgi:hypothetical protein